MVILRRGGCVVRVRLCNRVPLKDHLPPSGFERPTRRPTRLPEGFKSRAGGQFPGKLIRLAQSAGSQWRTGEGVAIGVHEQLHDRIGQNI